LITFDGDTITSGTIYDNLTLRRSDFTKFYEGSTDLSEIVTIPADEATITNFAYDKDAGIITYDYDIVIQPGRVYGNSTGN
ncbi:hypothetical protein, partial [Fulvivirga aurantia]|uniref:hypothetical protein n=1 Tax=Fulvivirga aurantia TaxID=2529383 RepID=UPI001625949C